MIFAQYIFLSWLHLEINRHATFLNESSFTCTHHSSIPSTTTEGFAMLSLFSRYAHEKHDDSHDSTCVRYNSLLTSRIKLKFYSSPFKRLYHKCLLWKTTKSHISLNTLRRTKYFTRAVNALCFTDMKIQKFHITSHALSNIPQRQTRHVSSTDCDLNFTKVFLSFFFVSVGAFV